MLQLKRMLRSVQEEACVEEVAENEQVAATGVIAEEEAEEQVVDNASDLYEEIRKYRYNKAKEELLKVQGFGRVKVDKYGDDLLNIINKYVNI